MLIDYINSELKLKMDKNLKYVIYPKELEKIIINSYLTGNRSDKLNIDEILSKYQLVEDEYKIYSFEELKQIKPGDLFHHKELGFCKFDLYQGDLCGFFDGIILAYALIKDQGYPWNIPMKKINKDNF